MTATFRLKVQRLNDICLFELRWGRGQQLVATVSEPEALTRLYQDWQRAYLNFYKTVPLAIKPMDLPDQNDALRGRAGASGDIFAPPNWQAKLVQAEASLLYAFHQWLRSAELYEIRQQIVRCAATLTTPEAHVDLALTCDPIDLERLPWEAWEIGAELGTTAPIRIFRTPANIRAEAQSRSRQKRRRARILAILGDDTGLNFQAERDAVRSLAAVAEVQFMGWQAGQSPGDLKTQICQAIADEQGWDGLFFAGHSNETAMTGGELAIAPGVVMMIREMTQPLTVAKENGLKFAIFNSCNGLSIAESLIDLGLSQVVIMREPIHNQVAQEFLLAFLRHLATFQDLHASVLAACRSLQLERHLTYPSAYLIPSLFCHPDAERFRLESIGWRHRLRPWLPTRVEAIALGILLPLSLWSDAQDFLLAQRLWVQAAYRDVTRQVPAVATQPVTLVRIDEKSIRRAGISTPNPLDRAYLSRLIDRLTILKATVVGLDYVLDRPQPGKDPLLAKSVKTAVQQNATWFVFGSQQRPGEGEIGVSSETGIASFNWSLQGSLEAYPWYMELPTAPMACSPTCPFSYLLTLARTLQQTAAPERPQPQLQSQTDFRAQVLRSLQQADPIAPSPQRTTLTTLKHIHLSPLTTWVQPFDQLWLQPIIDFSVPPTQVYNTIAAWQLLEPAQSASLDFRQTIVIISQGGYEEAGVTASEPDNFPVPPAIRYWRSRSPTLVDPQQPFAGSEAHAYMVNQLLTHRLVIPIPDLWLVSIVVLMGKGIALSRQRQLQRRSLWWLIPVSLAYGLISLQMYLSVAVLLPWVLPIVTAWVYILPTWVRKKTHG
ncbi:MAG: CHASE2 domain-containing protein [Leptolyngbya sp. BL-A-14]